MHPEGVILNHSDPTECYVLFTSLVPMDEIYNLIKDPSWVGGSMSLTIMTTTLKCIEYCK